MVGIEIKGKRSQVGLSQAKLAKITGVDQARISAFELGKIKLDLIEIQRLSSCLENFKESDLKLLKKKNYQNSQHLDSSLAQRPRRGYEKTERNDNYLEVLSGLESNFIYPKKSHLKAISFFAGCGGLCYGVKSAGFEIVATNELVEAYRKIYSLNFPEANFLANDIQTISNSDIDIILKKNGEIDLLIGGPPCQGFSLAGKRDVGDKRNTLFFYYLKIAEQIKPKVILIENVRLLTSMKDDRGVLVCDNILSALKFMGYNSSFFYVNAKDYGVPQHRERVIFIAVRSDINKLPSIPRPIYSNSAGGLLLNESCFTFGDAVSDLEFIESGEKSIKDKHHWAVDHPEHVIRWLIDVPEGKSAHDNENECMRPPSGYNTTYKRQIWYEPAGTVATTYGMISGCRNVHPIATRALTTREALRLQSFPDSFKLTGNNGSIRTVIGNAVPPLLGFELARYIRDTYMQ